jgi:hypothetical protein
MKNKFVLLASFLLVAGLSLVAVQSYNDVKAQRAVKTAAALKQRNDQKEAQQNYQYKSSNRINELYGECIRGNAALVQSRSLVRLNCGLYPLQ